MSSTPIVDFVRQYARSGTSRLHMPGHKGQPFLGCEAWDITEIKGADELYEAEGIIARSEANATALFGTARTYYSTEGSSQCIRAMLALAFSIGPDTPLSDEFTLQDGKYIRLPYEQVTYANLEEIRLKKE